MMEVKGKKKFTGKGTKTPQEKNRFHKNNGKIVIPKHAFHAVVLALLIGGRGWWNERSCSRFQSVFGRIRIKIAGKGRSY